MLVRKQTNLVAIAIQVGLVCLGLLSAVQAQALEFRSVAINKAILYDAPSTEAKKLYLLGNGYPVEVIVNLGEWIKVRDHFGSLSWVQSSQLSTKRTALIVTDQAELKQSDDDGAALMANFEKDVVVEVLPATAKSGWVKVKHRDGATGFVRSTALWGI
jgi:SH3-like domain-containing protein